MSRVLLHNVAENWSGILDATIASGALSLVLNSAQSYPTVPFKFYLGTERLRCSAVALDTPSSGKDTLTVTRGEDNTTAAQHVVGKKAVQWASAYDFQELIDRIDVLTFALAKILGDNEGVQFTYGENDLKVEAQASPDMTVKVNPGVALVSGQIAAVVSTTNTDTIIAPATNPRIDIIQVAQDGTVSVKSGAEAGSPSAPSVDSNNQKLAEIYLRVGATSIKDTDDASNGYITDSRAGL